MALPEFYDFVQFQQGYLQLATDTSYITNDNFNSYRFNSQTIHHTWAIENVPSLKEEEFTTTLSNHIAKVEFQLAAIRFPNAPMRTIMSSWQEVADELLKDEDFAADLQKENNWLNDDIKKLQQAQQQTRKKEKIFEFVRIILPAPIIMQYIFHSPSKKLTRQKRKCGRH